MAVRPKTTKPAYRLIEPEQFGKALSGPPKMDPGNDDDAPITITSTSELPGGGIEFTYGKPKAEEIASPDDNFDRNLAEDMDDFDLNSIAARLLQQIENDEMSRRDWEETANMGGAYLGIKLEDPTTSVSVDGTVSKMVATCMLEAAMKMWGVSRTELLPVSGPVKVRIDEPPQPNADEEAKGAAGETADAPPSADGGITRTAGPSPGGIAGAPPASPSQQTMDKDNLGRALEMDMNHYLTVVDRAYYPDTSIMLMHRNIVGVGFKKVYRCPLLRRPVSRYVKAQNLIISNDASHLDDSGRRTERITMSQGTMRRMMVAGAYRDISLVHPTPRPSPTDLAIEDVEGIAAVSSLPEDADHTVYECYCELGSSAFSNMIGSISRLDRDETGKRPGYPLPYRISLDVDTRAILEIRRNWKNGDKDHRARRKYVKFGFIPGLGYYNLGLIHIVGNPTQAATMIQRAMVDSSIYANFPGGVYMQGASSAQQNTVFRPNPGEWLPVKPGSASRIQDIFMAMPYRPPTPEIMALVEKLEGDVKRLSSVMEIPVGEGRLGNTPVGTIMSYIESISQVPGAVHKDDHIAQQEEFMLLRELFAEDPESLVRGVKNPARRWQIADEIMDPEIVPAADPNTPSEIHRLLKVQCLVTAAGLPQFQGIAEQHEVWRLVVSTLTGRTDGFTAPPQVNGPAPPDPKIMAAKIKADADLAKVQTQQKTEAMKHDERMQEMQADQVQRIADRESAETRAAMSLQAARLKAEHDTANAHADRQHEAMQGHMDRTHEAVQGQQDRTHEVTQSQQDRTHEAMQGYADRQQADTHKQADIQQQQFTAGLTAADNHLNRQADQQQAKQAAKTKKDGK